VVVANVVPGKGVLELLRALSPHARDMGIELTIIGSLDMAPAYASECVALVQSDPHLERRVRFLGAVAHSSLPGALAGADVLVSASRMESSGMALLDARACGIPIVARRGGNVDTLVHGDAGGLLTSSDDELAEALVHLASARDDLRSRRALARSSRIARSWELAARDFARLTSGAT
jgi:glycosyltransferase involved in cell wall biosynthesis